MRLILNKNVEINKDSNVLKLSGYNIRPIQLLSDISALLSILRNTPQEKEVIIKQLLAENIEVSILDELLDANVLKPELEIVDFLLPKDLVKNESDSEFCALYREMRGYTMMSPALCYGIYQSVLYISTEGIPGDIVFTGVWRGGAVALAAKTLVLKNDVSRKIYLYDSFDWTWPEPSKYDETLYGRDKLKTEEFVVRQAEYARSDTYVKKNLLAEERVRKLVEDTGYPEKNIISIKGYTTDTLPERTPQDIAFLHLDTDFYESTLHELRCLYAKVSSNGFLIIDDYPTEKGAALAVEEFFESMHPKPFFHRLDYQGRLLQKTL